MTVLANIFFIMHNEPINAQLLEYIIMLVLHISTLLFLPQELVVITFLSYINLSMQSLVIQF